MNMFHSLWQFALMAILAGIIVRALRRNSATTRYGVLVITMGGLALFAPSAFGLAHAPAFEQRAAEAVAKTLLVPEPTTKHEGIIEEVTCKLIQLADGKAISTDGDTEYARLTDKGEAPAERKDLKKGLRVRYEFVPPGKAAAKVTILPGKAK